MRRLFWTIALIVMVLVVIPALAALAFATFWLVRLAVPVLLIGMGVWLILATLGRFRGDRPTPWGGEDWRRKRQAWEARRRASLPRPVGRSVPPATGPNPVPPSEVKPPDLPIEIEVKVEQIRRKIEVLLGYAERFPVFSQDLYLVRQTASDYLPRTLNAYKALAASGGAEVTTSSGKTAREELREQIGLLDSKLDEITLNLQRRDLDQLLANRRFLEERFGHRSA